MLLRSFVFALAGVLSLHSAYASELVAVYGVVHDPQHRPMAGATVTLHAANSDFVLSQKTNSSGSSTCPLSLWGSMKSAPSSPVSIASPRA